MRAAAFLTCYSLLGVPDLGCASFLAVLCGIGLVASMRRSTSSSSF